MYALGIIPDEIAFNTMLDGCSKSGNLDLAFKVFEKMKQMNIKAGIITYNSLIDACVRGHQM